MAGKNENIFTLLDIYREDLKEINSTGPAVDRVKTVLEEISSVLERLDHDGRNTLGAIRIKETQESLRLALELAENGHTGLAITTPVFAITRLLLHKDVFV